LDGITDQIDVSFLDSVFEQAKTELTNFQQRAKDYSNNLGTKFQEDAQNSCDQCNKFGATFAHFTSFDNKNLQAFGDSCDKLCAQFPAQGCPGYDPAINANLKTDTTPTGELRIELPDGTFVTAPKQLADKVKENANPCLACKERACQLPKIGETITKSVTDIESNLVVMQDAIAAAETDLKSVVNKIVDHVKAIVGDSVKHLSNTFQDVNCEWSETSTTRCMHRLALTLCPGSAIIRGFSSGAAFSESL